MSNFETILNIIDNAQTMDKETMKIMMDRLGMDIKVVLVGKQEPTPFYVKR